jgi:protein-L-isoaspartate(D-aspartate) O-methyltransferase
MNTLGKLDTVFQLVPRYLFIPGATREQAEVDMPFSIGYGQTNSQPTTVHRMLEWLDVLPGQSVLDVGSGSGWTSALLAELVGDEGRVTAVEKVPELVTRSRLTLQRLGLHHIVVHTAQKLFGWPATGPYDRILVSASADTLPPELVDQLAAPGKMVIPVGNTIHEISKDEAGRVSDHEHPGYIFVPLIP